MSTQQSGLVAGNKQNTAGGSTPASRSMFPLSYSFLETERFAEYTPFVVMEGVAGDRLPLHSNHEVQTYTLKSPILQSLNKKKDYFMVPMQAILPLNWEKFYTNPVVGQDVPDDCGLGVVNFWQKMKTLLTNSFTVVSGYNTYDATELTNLVRFLLFFEQIYSAGSLMETLGISGHNWCPIDYTSSTGVERITYDEFFDKVISALESILNYPSYSFQCSIPGDAFTYRVVGTPSGDVSGYAEITLREFLEVCRDNIADFNISSVNFPSGFGGTLNTLIGNFDFTPMPDSDAPLNLGRLWAYQLIITHYYSNDHVDYIYSAELFRQYIRELSTRKTTVDSADIVGTFVINGLEYQYDSMSSNTFNRVISNFNSHIFAYTSNAGNYGPDVLKDAYAYFSALFGFKRSLRFLDYFTGGRANPLAVANPSQLDVNGPWTDVIDLSRSVAATKFLQAVNRSGRKFSAYMQELFHKTPAYDYHNPLYLAHTSDLVGAPETDNTGAGQLDTSRSLAVTSRFRATSSRYAFEFNPDRDCIIIGISYYDIPRVYTRATERQNFCIDRFDYFNPYFQTTGDQGIYEAELGTSTPDVSKNFAYTNADMQYKQRFNQACGGFCVPSTGLDNWIFEADTLRRKYIHSIGPSFIRSFNGEIDHFYQRLTGYSLGTYFHFIVRYDNRMDASRPMIYSPNIVA